MKHADYLELKQAIYLTCGKQRHWSRHRELLKQADTECSPQQKAAITRMLAKRNAELDYLDIYYSQI